MLDYTRAVDSDAISVAGARAASGAPAVNKRLLLVSILGTVATLIGLGFLHPFGDPRSGAGKALGAMQLVANMPANVRAVLIAKCADCHSNQTHWPVYARVAPGSWLIERDIVEGRNHLDLSRWDELTPDRRELLEAKISQEVRSGKMPPLQYLVLHWGARLSHSDIQALSTLNTSVAEQSGGGLGDPARGKLTFQRRCTGCHSMAANGEGPKLAGLLSRKAGSVARFDYSPALRKSGITWTDASLDKWLADPDLLVPGTTMEFRVSKAEERRDLIAYLKQ